MVKIKNAALTALLVLVAAGSASAQSAIQAGVGAALPDGKVAVINTQAFPGSINELKAKYEQVDGQFKDRYQRLQGVETRLKQLENDIRTKCPSLAPENCQQLQNQFEDEKKRGTREYEDLKADYDRTIETATKPIRDKMFQFLINFASQRSIVVVFNLAGVAQTQSIAYWNPGADITDDFIAEYNKANPVAGAAGSTTTPAKPGAVSPPPPTKPKP